MSQIKSATIMKIDGEELCAVDTSEKHTQGIIPKNLT